MPKDKLMPGSLVPLFESIGVTKEEFEDGISQYAQFLGSQGPDLDTEIKNLGENATARIEAANAWANNFFPEELHDAFLMMGRRRDNVPATS